MKAAIDLKNLWLYGKGIGSFTVNLLKDIAGNPASEFAVQLHSPSFEIPSLDFIHSHPGFQKIETGVFNKKSRIQKLNYDQFKFNSSLNRHKADILFSPYFDIPLLWRKKMVTTIHDLYLMDHKNAYGRAFHLYYKVLLEKAVKDSEAIVTVSEYTKNRLIKRFGLADEKIFLVFNKASDSFVHYNKNEETWDIIRSKHKLPSDYLLYTGGLESRKNIHLLINGLKEARKESGSIPPLVMTGINAEGLNTIRNLDPERQIIVLEYLSVSELAYLYDHCTLVVNTSSYEGFGFPVLESLTMRKPILCSDLEVYREIGKDQVYYFQNNDQKDFVNQLKAFFKGQLPALHTHSMLERADFYNRKNYSDPFFQLLKTAHG